MGCVEFYYKKISSFLFFFGGGGGGGSISISVFMTLLSHCEVNLQRYLTTELYFFIKNIQLICMNSYNLTCAFVYDFCVG